MALTALLTAGFAIAAPSAYAGNDSVKSWPRTDRHAVRAPVAGDFNPMGKKVQPQGRGKVKVDIFVDDANISNTDPNLKNTDTAFANENGIAINPRHINEVVMTSFVLRSNQSNQPIIPLWLSNNIGKIWSKDFSINVPTGVDPTLGFSGDQNADYTIDRGMAYATLIDGSAIYGALTQNPATGPFNWFAPGGVAQKANHLNDTGNVDQPWLLVGPVPDPAGAGVVSENVYIAYDDFANSVARVAVAPASDPLVFNVDNPTGVFDGGVNPGHRLAIDKSTGAVYSAWQNSPGPGAGDSQNVNYMLSRSTDGGNTWTLNGSNNGIIVANADSTQVRPKFCTVNSLRGGVDHIAIDPRTGDLIYVYGTRDPNTGSNRLALRRLTDNGNGGLNIGDEIIVVDGDNIQAAIPSVAVTDNGVIGLFYYTCDGIDQSGFPAFSAHFDISTDGGNTFDSRNTLQSFLSPVMEDPNDTMSEQRILGDYMQVKAVGETLYGSFVGNGVQFGRPMSIVDPIYYNVAVDLAEQKTSRR
jgi:hypothetical protein